ncbi:MAG: EamA family transporter [Chloroflexi bacterium]|nr:EamA family transporter [Chloroflexota bacterium]
MPLTALLLVLLSAFLHALYNFLVKSSRDTIAYYWWTIAIGSLSYGAWLIISGNGIYLAPASVPFYLISALAEIGFFVGMVRGYAVGDLSLVYPLARGLPPILVALWSALILNERLPALGYAGIAIVVAGMFFVSLTANGGDQKFRARDLLDAFRNPATRWALLSGVFIAVYSFTDKLALSNGTPPTVYNFWVFFGNLIGWLPLVWRRSRVQTNFELVRVNLGHLLVGAAAIIATYLFVLTALAMTSASYVTAGRSLAVVIGALLGTLALKEGFGRARVFGAAMIVAGIALMALA